MAEKEEKDVDFNEALRRIANTPKDAVLDKGLKTPKKSATKKPAPAKRVP